MLIVVIVWSCWGDVDGCGWGCGRIIMMMFDCVYVSVRRAIEWCIQPACHEGVTGSCSEVDGGIGFVVFHFLPWAIFPASEH